MHYSEKQRFRHWWLSALILIAPAMLLWLIFQTIVLDQSANNEFVGNIWIIVICLIFGAGMPAFIYMTTLSTEVRNDGVYVRFNTLHINWVVFEFNDIQKAEALTYRPIMEYGGWGIRFGKNGKAYNVSGNKGVLLTLSKGKTILIGSQNHEELSLAITQRL